MVIDHSGQVFAPRILMTHHMWVTWAEVAIEHLETARAIRAKAVDTGSNLIGEETRASLVAIVSVSHALDALYGAVKALVPDPGTRKRSRRESVILEHLKRGFRLGKKAQDWARDFEWAFNLRDVLHFEEATKDTLAHPHYGNTSPESATYCLETAERAVDFLCEVLSVCAANPKRETQGWVATYRGEVERLLEYRRAMES